MHMFTICSGIMLYLAIGWIYMDFVIMIVAVHRIFNRVATKRLIRGVVMMTMFTRRGLIPVFLLAFRFTLLFRSH